MSLFDIYHLTVLVVLTKMDGIELIRRIRAINKDIPIIMATAVVDQKVSQEAAVRNKGTAPLFYF
ncbi:MAG: hypothetical protein U9R44_04075 [Candidatus Omnitrophota bacterium]|nr:hypothetical protein [Candidatus Omnitrophota bacterium]